MPDWSIPQMVLYGTEVFLLVFFIFIVLYILVRLFAEKKGHVHPRTFETLKEEVDRDVEEGEKG